MRIGSITLMTALVLSTGLATATGAQTPTVTSCGDRLERLRHSESNLAVEQTRLQSLQGQLDAMKTLPGSGETSTDLAQRNADRLAMEQQVARQQVVTEQIGGAHNNLVMDYNGNCIGQ